MPIDDLATERERPPSRAALRRLVVLAIALVPLAQVPQMRVAAVELHRGLCSAREHWRDDLTRPGAGEKGLSAPILSAVELLRSQAVREYRYSAAVQADPFARQRIVEGAWPIRYRAGSDIVLSLLTEPNDCVVIAEYRLSGPIGGWRLARCP